MDRTRDAVANNADIVCWDIRKVIAQKFNRYLYHYRQINDVLSQIAIRS
ncbi:hypothetical protein OB894_01515 [Bacillus subtilis]